MDTRVIRYFEGSLAPEDRSLLLREMISDEEVMAQMILCQQIGSLTELSREKMDRPAGERSYLHFIQGVKRRNRYRRVWRTVAWAAAIAVLVLGGWSLFRTEAIKDSLSPVSTLIVTTGPAQREDVTLPDGTQVTLNANTTLSYPSRFQRERRVSIMGEALFDVVPDRAHPFIVRMDQGEVEVLGTRFDVNGYAGLPAIISLLRGSVAFRPYADPGKVITLSPGEQVIQQGAGCTVRPFQGDSPIAWKNGFFVFDDRTLEWITQQLSAYYGIDIQIDDPALQGLLFTGKFSQSESPREILQILQKVYPFSILASEENGDLHLSSP